MTERDERDAPEAVGAPTLWARNVRTGIVQAVGENLLDDLLDQVYEDEDGNEVALYEQVDGPVGAVGGGSWEIVVDEGGEFWSRPVGALGTDRELGPYKSEGGAKRAVKRKYPNATFAEQVPEGGEG